VPAVAGGRARGGGLPLRTLLQQSRVVAVVLVVFAALGALLWYLGAQGDPTRDHSIRRKNAWGCAALADLCRTVHPALTVRELTQPLDASVPTGALLVVLDPTRPFSDEEIDAIVRWVRDGGTLLAGFEGLWDDLTVAQSGAGPPYVKLAAALGVAMQIGHRPWTVARPASGAPLGQGVRRVAITTRYSLQPLKDNAEARAWAAQEMHPGRVRCLIRHGPGDVAPQLTADGSSIVASFRHGRGRVYVTSDVQMLANALLGKDDNVAFAANLLWGSARQGIVYFDEYHHGFGPRRRAASQVDPAPLQRALFVVLAATVLLLAGRAVRFGAPRSAFDPRRRTAMEYVEGLADLWMRAQAHGWALGQIGHAFRQRLSTEAGLRPGAPPEALASALATRRGVPAEETEALLREIDAAQQATGIDPRQARRLVERIARTERTLDQEGRHPWRQAAARTPRRS
jgi:Domain of unknown function (DUF4350)